jgi:hypothetical protein
VRRRRRRSGEILLLLGLDAYGAMSVVLAAAIALIYAMRVRAWRTRGRS